MKKGKKEKGRTILDQVYGNTIKGEFFNVLCMQTSYYIKTTSWFFLI